MMYQVKKKCYFNFKCKNVEPQGTYGQVLWQKVGGNSHIRNEISQQLMQHHLVQCTMQFLLNVEEGFQWQLYSLCFLLQVILYQGGQMFDGAPRFHGRVGFTGTMPATNVSIFINNTQLSDTGTYQCLVNNLPDRGGRNIGVTGLTVLGE